MDSHGCTAAAVDTSSTAVNAAGADGLFFGGTSFFYKHETEEVLLDESLHGESAYERGI